MDAPKYVVSRFPDSRLATIDLGYLGRQKHHVAALVELDVTTAVAQLRERKARGEDTSFFSWFVATSARVVAKVPGMHSLRLGKTSLVTFEDVDVSVMIEREVEGRRVPLPALLRSCDKKSAVEVHREIQAARAHFIEDEGDFVLGAAKRQRGRLALYYALPGWLRRRALGWFASNPFRSKREMGTVVVTSVGSLVSAPGWFVPRSMHNLCFALGAIVKKPWAIDEQVQIRDILHLTVL